jgi:hypothetical protein
MLSQPPSPEQQMATQLAVQGQAAKNQETQSRAAKNMAQVRESQSKIPLHFAKAQQALQPKPAAAQPQNAAEFEMPPIMQMQQHAAETQKVHADTLEKLARADHLAASAEQVRRTPVTSMFSKSK